MADVSPESEHDVALVRLEPQAADASPQPAMLLSRTVPPGDIAFAPGFPTYQRADNSIGDGYRLVKLEYELVEDRERGTKQLNITDGEIADGLSGSAVVSASSLAVVGVVRYRRPKADGLAGGGALAISEVIKRFPDVEQLAVAPPPATFPWRSLTLAPGMVTDGSWPRIEVSISGNGQRWAVDELSQEGTQDVTIAAFGAEVGRAVFAWVSGRRPTSEEEVRWSGQLLGLALLAGSAGRKVREHHFFGESFDLPLNFKAASELEDAPWELAWMPGAVTAGEGKPDIERYLAARSHTSLTRVDPSASAPRGPSDQPLTVQAFVPRESRVASSADVMSLGQSTTRISLSVRDDDSYAEELIGLIERTKPTIVHYIGYARHLRESVPEILIGTKRDGDFLAIADLAKACGGAGVRLLVLQCRAPRPRREWGPPPAPYAYRGLLKGGPEAIIFTQYAVSPKSLAAFNRSFYQELNRGTRVEGAVQVARATLRTYYYKDEPSAFGAFVVVTGPSGGPSLLTPRDVETRSGQSYAPETASSRQAGPRP